MRQSLGWSGQSWNICHAALRSWASRTSPHCFGAWVFRKVRDLPWSTAQDHAERHFPDGSNVFGELHLTMVAAACSERGALVAAFERLRTTSEKGHEGAAVAMRWTEALIKLLDGDSESAREHLDYCQATAVRLGGSNAQRSVVSETRQTLRVPVAL